MNKVMKKWALALFTLAVTGFTMPNEAQAKPAVGISLQVFYDSLNPYGRWVNDRQYGYLWIPNVERGFQPYATRGHWIQTSFGNTWVSDYDWGWAPFHYGRWVYDDYYGWAWIPGDEWGPAWVNWRSGGGYYGWTPMGPGVNINININIPLARWIFVPQRYICYPQVYNYRVDRRRGGYVYQNTIIINNYVNYNNRRYSAGPRFDEIERVTNRPVRVYAVNDVDRPGRANVGRNSVELYRPSIDPRTSDRPSRTAPTDRNDDNRYNSRSERNDNIGNKTPDRSQGVYGSPSGGSPTQRPERNDEAGQSNKPQVTDNRDRTYSNGGEQRAERPGPEVIQQQQRDRAEQVNNDRRERSAREQVQRAPEPTPRREEQPRSSREVQQAQPRQQDNQRSQPSRSSSGSQGGRPQRVG